MRNEQPFRHPTWLLTKGAPLAEGVDAIMALLAAKYWMTITQPGRGTIAVSARSLLIFKRGKDRKWRIGRDMNNMAPDVRKEDRPS